MCICLILDEDSGSVISTLSGFNSDRICYLPSFNSDMLYLIRMYVTLPCMVRRLTMMYVILPCTVRPVIMMYVILACMAGFVLCVKCYEL